MGLWNSTEKIDKLYDNFQQNTPFLQMTKLTFQEPYEYTMQTNKMFIMKKYQNNERKTHLKNSTISKV